MYFAIQACNPISQTPEEKHFFHLYEAIGDIFPYGTEEAYLLWNWIPVRINYSDDLYVLIDDIILMLEKLLSNERGIHQVYWGSNTFRAEWHLEWSEGTIKMKARWESIAGNYEELLNSRNQIEMRHDDFLYEWKTLLRTIISSIEQTGVEIEEQDELETLMKLEKTISNFGCRYQHINQ